MIIFCFLLQSSLPLLLLLIRTTHACSQTQSSRSGDSSSRNVQSFLLSLPPYSCYLFIIFHQGCTAYSRCKCSPGHPVFSCIGAVRLSFLHYPYTFPRTCRSFPKLVNLAGFPIFLALVCAVLIIIIEHTSYLSYSSFHLVTFFFYEFIHLPFTHMVSSLSTSTRPSIRPSNFHQWFSRVSCMHFFLVRCMRQLLTAPLR